MFLVTKTISTRQGNKINKLRKKGTGLVKKTPRSCSRLRVYRNRWEKEGHLVRTLR